MKEYIEREAAVAAVRDIDTSPAYINADDAIEQAMYKLDKLIPAADVAPVRHGRWLKLSDGSPYCSICGAVERNTYDAVTEECKYCYSCGARMDGKENNI